MKSLFAFISIISIIFLFHAASFAITIGTSTDSGRNEGQNILDKKETPDGVRVYKTTIILNKREGNKLFTTAGVYDISGAKIIDLTINKKTPPHQKKSAELTFINGRLTEVVIQ